MGCEKGVKTLPKWPPTSPDLNVCDYYLWSVMQKYVDDQNPRDEEELHTVIIGAGKSLTQDEITRATRQFPRRLELCIKAGGGRLERRKKSPGDIDTLADGPGAVQVYEGYVEFVEDECDQNKQEAKHLKVPKKKKKPKKSSGLRKKEYI